MNLFRKADAELQVQLESYKDLIKDFQTQIDSQNEKLNELTDTVNEPTSKLITKEEIIQEKTEEVETLEEKIETLEESVEEKQELIEEVIENTVSVEKQAAIKALEILAEAGVPVMETIDSPKEIDLMGQMQKLKGQELVEFYRANKQELRKSYK